MTAHGVTERRPHVDGCPRPGFRYGATVRRTAATVAAGTAGRVILYCKAPGCGAERIV